MEKCDIKSLTFEELSSAMEKEGQKAFRSKQIYQWIHEKLADSFDDMSNLPQALRERLKEEYSLISLKKADVRISKDRWDQKISVRLRGWKYYRKCMDEV